MDLKISEIRQGIKFMSYWNYRILAKENDEELYFQLHEVYYENDVPYAYTSDPVAVESETLTDLKLTLKYMKHALKKPVLWYGEKFPTECKIKYKCDLCGRNNFDSPSPHNCINGFRRRKFEWTLIAK